MTTLLTDNLPLLAGAPNGIKKLRELILELAVRGKLVEQDASDEPASELLKRIAAEKARLVAEGKIKKQKPLADIREEDKPFDVPANWAWVRVAAVGHDWGQKTPDQEFTYIDVGSVDKAVGVISAPQVLMAEDAPSRARKIVRPGTVIYSTIRPYLLNIAVINEVYAQEPIASTAFAIIHPYLDMPSKYYLWYLRSPVFVRYVESVQMGIAYPAINDGQFFNGLIPLPPLAEQHRIVAKVDELMALCDRLETQQTDAASAHAQLVQALLGSLTQASVLTARDGGNAGNAGTISGHEFAANWQRLAEHFHTLFSTEPSIDALKQTLLQLAVMGKLVPQDPGDEPASELLKRIEAEKQRLVAEGKLKKQKPLEEIVDEKRPFLLPPAWAWVKPEEFSMKITDGEHFKPDTEKTGVYFLSAKDIRDDGVSLENPLFISEEAANKALQRCDPQYGDLLIVSRGATVGRMCKVNVREKFCLLGSVILIKPSEHVLSEFLSIALKSPDSFRQLVNASGSTAQPAIYLRDLKKIALPLPPLAEQHRIVAKVDQLMALCDQLKTQLSQARQLNQQLASTLVEQAVA